MEIEIDITRKDFQEFNGYVLTKKKVFKKYYFIGYIILALLFLLANINRLTDLSYMITQLLIIVLILVIFRILFSRLNLFLCKFIPSDKGGILGKHKFAITKEGLMETTETAQTLLKWNGIQSVETNDKYIFVFIDRHMAHVIPKRFFASETDCANFIRALNNKESQCLR